MVVRVDQPAKVVVRQLLVAEPLTAWVPLALIIEDHPLLKPDCLTPVDSDVRLRA